MFILKMQKKTKTEIFCVHAISNPQELDFYDISIKTGFFFYIYFYNNYPTVITELNEM